ncbi:hypothetical protein RSM67_001685 [Enterobacter roggenkampii]|nr:hypothetical protein [Escherichia coli]ELI9003987.1 hypothetical protein [Enterobacter roggenkampii]MBU5620503.1 hypothetical protein [Enterobacteriaceae bacterium S5_ASV_15]HBY0140826.1 hypothetical protein [Klebsiella pneumoniae]
MIVPEVVFYISLAAWVLYWWFITSITKKIGIVVVPLTLVFGCYIYAIQMDNLDQQAHIGWEQTIFFAFVIVVMWAGKLVMRKLSE